MLTSSLQIYTKSRTRKRAAQQNCSPGWTNRTGGPTGLEEKKTTTLRSWPQGIQVGRFLISLGRRPAWGADAQLGVLMDFIHRLRLKTVPCSQCSRELVTWAVSLGASHFHSPCLRAGQHLDKTGPQHALEETVLQRGWGEAVDCTAPPIVFQAWSWELGTL